MKVNRAFLLCLLITLPRANEFTQSKPEIENSAQPEFFGTIGEGVYSGGFFGFTLGFPKNCCETTGKAKTSAGNFSRPFAKVIRRRLR
ncbi:MAG TPA: hypothetical protein VGB00_04750 [Pyrinomonadaceae bacterium]|jgi:hypothetical protein